MQELEQLLKDTQEEFAGDKSAASITLAYDGEVLTANVIRYRKAFGRSPEVVRGLELELHKTVTLLLTTVRRLFPGAAMPAAVSLAWLADHGKFYGAVVQYPGGTLATKQTVYNCGDESLAKVINNLCDACGLERSPPREGQPGVSPSDEPATDADGRTS